MASDGRRKNTATGIMVMAARAVLILWLCTGFGVCEDELPYLNADPPGGTPENPPEFQPSIANTDVSPDDGFGGVPPGGEESGVWGDVVGEDASEAPEEEDEGAQQQSEAPQTEEEDINPTENPLAEAEPVAKATSVSSQKPAPTEPPEERGDFVVRGEDGAICLRACFAALLKIDYVGQDEESKVVNRTAEIPVPEKAHAGGWCDRGPSEQSALILEWDETRYRLKITFQKKNATSKGDPNFWVASRIQFSFDTRDNNYFEAAENAGPRTVHTDPGATFFATPEGNSRVCDSEDDIIMSPSNKTLMVERVTMEISHLQMQPYGMINGTFSEGADCGEDLLVNPNTNVASIAVGATLACLILVVIIVYAVGRKMGAINDRSGYKSVE